MAIVKLPDYPIPGGIGSRIVSVFEFTGPASYVAMVNGTPPTGGQSLGAVGFGMKFIEWMEAGLSNNGQFTVEITYAGPTGATATVLARWIVSATGAEVAGATNLSTFRIRALVIGR